MRKALILSSLILASVTPAQELGGAWFPAVIDCLMEVDPRDLDEHAWQPGPLSPIEWSHTDPEHLS